MRVTIVGTHGIPAHHGGFETFAAHLANACVKAGIQIRVINQKSNPTTPCPENVEIISSKYNKSTSPLKFYRESLKLAAADSDIIISCGVGGAFFYPSIKKTGVKIITHVDGLDHKRRKYSLLQRAVIYYLQYLANKRSDYLIADSQEIWGYWVNRFPGRSKKLKFISYGADECLPVSQNVLTQYKLVKNEYYLVIARLVPENNIEEIIKSFNHYIGKKKLVIVGALENTSYIKRLRNTTNPRIVFTDAIYDKSILDTLRQECFIYIHGHSVGGTNPSLLEAMAAGCACLCHDNVFNLEVTEGSQIYFHSEFDLPIMLNLLEHKTNDLEVHRVKALERVRKEYSWDTICSTYFDLFTRLYRPVKTKVLAE